MADENSRNIKNEEIANALLDGLGNVTEEFREMTISVLDEIFSDALSYYKNRR